MPKKNMQLEIKKYQGKIFYLNERIDPFVNRLTPSIEKANWINSTKDYDHSSFELHHVIPFTDWELNTGNIQEKEINALILLPNSFARPMHQHLENPIYKLSKSKFTEIYGINPDVILYDINSKLPRSAELFTKGLKLEPFEYDGCFDVLCNENEEKETM